MILVNVRKTGQGEPKGSYTVHADLACRAAAGRARAKPHLWATSTIECVEQLSSEILFGACGVCASDIGSKRAGVWAAAGPAAKDQMPSGEAKRKLEDCATGKSQEAGRRVVPEEKEAILRGE